MPFEQGCDTSAESVSDIEEEDTCMSYEEEDTRAESAR